MLMDPERFVNDLDQVEPSWLDWVRREGRHKEAIRGLVETPKRFSRFVDKVGWVLKNWDLDRAGAMAALVPSEGIAAMAGRSPLAALRFCTHALALSNHRGDVTRGRPVGGGRPASFRPGAQGRHQHVCRLP